MADTMGAEPVWPDALSRPLLDVPWPITETVIGGKPAIDLQQLDLQSLAEAEEFLRCYGFDWRNPSCRQRVEALRCEAIEFLEVDLLADEPEARIPCEVRRQEDVRQLLLWASEQPRAPRGSWACALLKAMHTFTYCGSDLQTLFGEQIRAQILDRFEVHLHRTPTGLFLGRGPHAIPLADFQQRGTKTRRSLAMKLLHKPGNVATDIFDWIGVRFVTEERLDALLVARYLRVNNVIMFAHIRPERSRNTLLDLPRVKEEMRRLREQMAPVQLPGPQRLALLREMVRHHPYPAGPRASGNPYSVNAYHSIQFTCRQEIVVPAPALAQLAGSIRFFYPFEVQILDRESFREARTGPAAHAEYKERQRQAAKQRLLGHLLGEGRSRPHGRRPETPPIGRAVQPCELTEGEDREPGTARRGEFGLVP